MLRMRKLWKTTMPYCTRMMPSKAQMREKVMIFSKIWKSKRYLSLPNI